MTIPPAEWVSPLHGVMSALQIKRWLKMQGHGHGMSLSRNRVLPVGGVVGLGGIFMHVVAFSSTEFKSQQAKHNHVTIRHDGKRKATLKKNSKAKLCPHQWHSSIQLQN